ncbi:MAG: serine hydrolase domain-containing protein [bacterium]|nr:serine hydrolase domain-containing protein [bacterium]
MTEAIDQMMEQAVERGVFPAATLLVANKETILHHKSYGKARTDTCFDIASLTKPIATATLAMEFVQEGLLKLEDTTYQWLGGARDPFHRKMTVAHLLSHTSGMPAWKPFYRELPIDQIGTPAGKQHIVLSCLQEPIFSEPGFQCVYSDLGYILLGEILEQAGSASLDVLFQNRIAAPLGLKDTFFVRTVGSSVFGLQSSVHKRRFAPTEDCPWRGHVLHGEVHDQNCYAMGGVAGHAGLFSTAGDIHKFVAELLKCYRGESDWLSSDIVKQFTDEQRGPSLRSGSNTYVFGWDTPTFGSSTSGTGHRHQNYG